MVITKELYEYRRNDLRWTKKTLEIKDKFGDHCQKCNKKRGDGAYRWIVIHHKYYIEDREPWDYPDEAYQILCNYCHNKIDHSLIPRHPNPNIIELQKLPFILTKVFFRKGRVESLSYDKYFDIRYYGWIIDCGYQTGERQGDGRFDYELIVRELMNSETAFSDRRTGEIDKNVFRRGPTPKLFKHS